jgi:hypothetical protein
VLYLTILCFFAFAVRHYEIVYLIHEDHEEEVAAVNEKVQGNLLQFAALRSFFPNCLYFYDVK